MKKLSTYNQFITENNQNQQTVLNNDQVILNKVNKIIEYTIIKSGTIKDNINEAISTAVTNGYYGIVVNPELVDHTNYEIEDKPLKTISVLDFPNGDMPNNERLTEVIRIIADGADEIDMAIDIEKFKKGYRNIDTDTKNAIYDKIEESIKEIADECHKNGVILKVIIESGVLSLEELKDICHIVTNANVDFVQTSSGIKEIGAELAKVKEIRRLLPDYIKIKAAGGIRNIQDANKFYPYVDRIGTSVILK